MARTVAAGCTAARGGIFQPWNILTLALGQNPTEGEVKKLVQSSCKVIQIYVTSMSKIKMEIGLSCMQYAEHFYVVKKR